MRAVTFQAPGEVRVDEKPDPELTAPGRGDRPGRVERRLRLRPPHLPRAGRDRARVHDRPRVRRHRRRRRRRGRRASPSATASSAPTARPATSASSAPAACSTSATTAASSGTASCSASSRAPRPSCSSSRTPTSPCAGCPSGMSDDVALFAGDVMGTGYHAVVETGIEAGLDGRRPRPRAGRPLRGAGGDRGRSREGDRRRHRRRAARDGAVVRRRGGAPDRGGSAGRRQGRRPRAEASTPSIDAVGHPDVLELACKMARKCGTVSVTGVYAERADVHMGIVWLKALTLKTGHANVIKHVDPVLAALADGTPRPDAARHPPHEARRRARGLRGLRPPRGAEDRPDAVSGGGRRAQLGAVRGRRDAGRRGRRRSRSSRRPGGRRGSSRSISAPRSGRSARRRRSPTTRASSSRAAASSPSSTSRRSRSGRSSPSASCSGRVAADGTVILLAPDAGAELGDRIA